jgi:hypothetical protein
MGSIQKIKLGRLLYTHYQHPSLSKAHEFFIDFGFHAVQQNGYITYYHSFGENPCIYVAEKSPDDSKHFVTSGCLLRTREDLENASTLPGGTTIKASSAPGGGECVDITDPNGVKMRLIHGVALQEKEEQKEEILKPVVFNSWEEKSRKGEFQRFDTGPSKVHKLGHFGLVVDKSLFEDMVAWYLDNFSLAPTDSLYDEESGKDMMTFMHIDKDEEFTDHHVSLNGTTGALTFLRETIYISRRVPNTF